MTGDDKPQTSQLDGQARIVAFVDGKERQRENGVNLGTMNCTILVSPTMAITSSLIVVVNKDLFNVFLCLFTYSHKLPGAIAIIY